MDQSETSPLQKSTEFEGEPEVDTVAVAEALGGLASSMHWLLEKFHVDPKELPQIKIGEHTGSLAGVSAGIIRDEKGQWIIGIQSEHLYKLKQGDIITIIPKGVHPALGAALTIKQEYEEIGLEELLHIFQSRGVEGTVPLPPEAELIPPISGGGEKYFLQPHEFQAVKLRGEYYLEKYGRNPFKNFEEFLEKKKLQNEYFDSFRVKPKTST